MGDSNNDDYFKGWYAKNRDQLNERRRQRYANDPARREQAVKYQCGYRQGKSRPSTKGSPHFRTISGKLREVFRISEAAEQAGCSVEFIRKYELLKVIPKPLVPSTQRYYTQKQVALIKDFFDVMAQLKHNKDPGLKALALQQQTQVFQSNWTGD